MNTKNMLLSVGAAVLAVSTANAASTCLIDINGLTAQFAGAGGFGVNATGTITLSFDGNSALVGVALDGFNQNLGGNTLTGFTGTINLVGGQVTGGLFSATTTAGTYGANIVGGIGAVAVQAGQGYSIDGLTFNGLFSGPTFAGVNIGNFFTAQPLFGSVLTFAFNPNANGVDSDSDIDIFIQIPMPGAAAMGFVGLAGLAGVRRRR